MKRVLQIIFVTIMCFSLLSCFTVKAEEGILNLENIKVGEKSKAVGVNKLKLVNSDATNDMFFNKVGDYINYDVVIKNTSNIDLYINDINNDSDNEYITYEYPNSTDKVVAAGSEAVINVKSTYTKKSPNKVVSNETVIFNILYSNSQGHHNANTVDHIIIYISLFILSAIGFLLTFTYNKKQSNLFIMILLSIGVLLPFNARAESKVISFKLNNNITENSVSFLKTGKDIGLIFNSAISGKNLHWVRYLTRSFGDYDLFKNDYEYDYFDDDFDSMEFNNADEEDEYWDFYHDNLYSGNSICGSIKNATVEQYNSIKSSLNDSNIISLSNSENPTYYWIDNNIIYIFTSADKIMLNEDSSYLFAYHGFAKTIDLSKFDTSNVTDMSYMFYSCGGLTSLDLSNFNTSNVTNMSSFLSTYYYDELTGTENYPEFTSLDLSNFDTSNVTDMSSMFSSCCSLETLNISSFNTSKVKNMRYMFEQCRGLLSLDVTHFDTSNVTNMYGIFSGCECLTELDVTKFNTSKVLDMGVMFSDCSSLTELDVTSFDTSNVTNMYGMFSGCSGLTELDVTNFDTSKVTDLGAFISRCSNLTTIDLTHFNTSNVTKMNSMFSGLTKIKSLNLSNFDTSKVTDMNYMFCNNAGLESLDISNFEIAPGGKMELIFEDCTNLVTLDISGFNSDNIVDAVYAFRNCSSLKTIYVRDGFNFSSVQYIDKLFEGCVSLVGGAGTTFSSTNNYRIYARIDGGPSAPGYFTLKV